MWDDNGIWMVRNAEWCVLMGCFGCEWVMTSLVGGDEAVGFRVIVLKDVILRMMLAFRDDEVVHVVEFHWRRMI